MKINDVIKDNPFFLDVLDDPKNVGIKNTYEWIINNPTPEEIKKMLPFLEAMGKGENEIKGLLKLNEEEQKKIIKEIAISNYIYNLALEKLFIKKEDTEISQELFNFSDYEKLSLKNAYIPNSKVANELVNIAKDSLQGKKSLLDISQKNKETVNIIAYFEDNDKITIKGEPLTAFDTVVHRAVCNLWEAGKQEKKKDICFNLQQVYRMMNGTNDSNINDEVLAKIKRSIENSVVKRIVIDCTEQLEKWKKAKRKPKKAEYETYLLPLDRIKLVMPNGEQVEGYKFIKCPPLYAYSQDIEQVINIDIKLLETNHQGKKYRISNTTENIILRELLIKQIAMYKNGNNKIKNNLVNYNNLFEKAGVKTEELDRVQIKRKRENIKKILDHFIAEKYIKSYEEYKEGQQIKGLKIFF